METIAQNVSVYGKQCYGCQIHGKDVMIAMLVEGKEEHRIDDTFLTTEQAESLLEQLKTVLKSNDGRDLRGT